MATIVKYCGPGVTSVGDQARSSEQKRERKRERLPTYSTTDTRLRLDTLRSDPRAHCLLFRRQTARDVRTRDEEKERERERVRVGFRRRKGDERENQPYVHIGGYISSGERIRLEIIGRYTRIYVGRRSRRVYQDLTSGRERLPPARCGKSGEEDVRK